MRGSCSSLRCWRCCSPDACGRAERSYIVSTSRSPSSQRARERKLPAANCPRRWPGAPTPSADSRTRRSLDRQEQGAALSAADSLAAASQSLPRPATRAPVTLSLSEPFSTSVTVAFAFALLLGLPFLLMQAWAFVAPAIGPAERRAVRPLLLLAPALFAVGVAFGYFFVLPPAVKFLQGFNHGAFDVLVQARDYYRFELTTMLVLGAIFEIPVLLLALSRAGILSSTTLRRHRRYAIVGLAVMGGVLPGVDPVTTLLETLPLFALYEGSIVLLRFNEHRSSRRRSASSQIGANYENGRDRE